MALSWIDHELLPKIILTGSLEIIWANVAARSALARRRDLEKRMGMLASVNPQYQEGLEQLIVRSGASISSYCLHRSDGDGHLLLRAQQIGFAEEPIFGLSFFGSGSDFKETYVDLDVVFGLTRAECRVLNDLLDGHEADKLAKMHGVSLETTRSHIRSIYMKLNVNSREALFHRVRPFGLKT